MRKRRTERNAGIKANGCMVVLVLLHLEISKPQVFPVAGDLAVHLQGIKDYDHQALTTNPSTRWWGCNRNHTLIPARRSVHLHAPACSTCGLRRWLVAVVHAFWRSYPEQKTDVGNSVQDRHISLMCLARYRWAQDTPPHKSFKHNAVWVCMEHVSEA
jgi:hypothetical protein